MWDVAAAQRVVVVHVGAAGREERAVDRRDGGARGLAPALGAQARRERLLRADALAREEALEDLQVFWHRRGAVVVVLITFTFTISFAVVLTLIVVVAIASDFFAAIALDLIIHGDGWDYDGIAFGIETMRRVRAVLDAETAGRRGRSTADGKGGARRGLIDLHCGNNYPTRQYGHVSPALQFMHLMPYIDSLWFGEGDPVSLSPS